MIRFYKMNILFYLRVLFGVCGKVYFLLLFWLLYDLNLYFIDVNSDNFLVFFLDFVRFFISLSRIGYYNGFYDDYDFE